MSELQVPVWKLFLKTYPIQIAVTVVVLVAVYVLGYILMSRKLKYQTNYLKNRQKSCDGLTGLYNASAFREMVRNHMVTVSDLSTDALLLFDADDMQQINNEQGTLQGDLLLKNFADVLQKQFRSTDIIGRIESDSFAVYMNNAGSLDFVKRKCTSMLEQAIDLPISIGLTMISGREPFIAAFKRAEDALQKAKYSGKNQFVIA